MLCEQFLKCANTVVRPDQTLTNAVWDRAASKDYFRHQPTSVRPKRGQKQVNFSGPGGRAEAGRSGAAQPHALGHFLTFPWVQEAQARLAVQGQNLRQTLAEAVAQRTVHDQMSAEAASQHADEMEKLRNEMRAAHEVQLQRQLCEVQVEHQEHLQRQAAQHNEQTAELSVELQAEHDAQLQLQQRLDEAQATREPQAAGAGGGERNQMVSCAMYIGSPDVGKRG